MHDTVPHHTTRLGDEKAETLVLLVEGVSAVSCRLAACKLAAFELASEEQSDSQITVTFPGYTSWLLFTSETDCVQGVAVCRASTKGAGIGQWMDVKSQLQLCQDLGIAMGGNTGCILGGAKGSTTRFTQSKSSCGGLRQRAIFAAVVAALMMRGRV